PKNHFALPYSYTNLFSEYFKFSGELYNNKETIDVKPYTLLELQIDLKVEKFEKDIGVCERFVNELNIFDLFTVGYYIFPAIIQFQNLKSLNLRKCSVSYSAWCIVNYTLNCLVSLKIDDVTFIVSTMEEFDESKIILGNYLRELKVDACNYWITDLPWETNKFIFNTVEDKNHDPVKLPLICIPTLREAAFSNYKVQGGWLAKFLILNPQLIAITIDLSQIDQSAINTLAKSSNLNEFNIQCWGPEPSNNRTLEFSKISSIKTLNIEYLCELSCDFIRDIILSCDNLNSLKYSLSVFSDCQTVITSFYTNTAPKLQNLKYLNIESGFEELMDLDLKNFSSVEHLEVGNCDQIVMDLELPNYATLLKKLTIYYDERNFKVEDIKKKFEKFTNWKCKFKKDKIVCLKLNNKNLLNYLVEIRGI
ncbi:hypothetical protein CONCODRAFT_169400, partial [Conidiobolus coronatus NRRL 28638]